MASSSQGTTTEYVVRVPKTKKKFGVMRFHNALKIDFKTWSHAKLERENNLKEYKSMEDEMPKFGAGSEYGREQREEARRKKYGIHMKKYRPDDQPWILTIGGKNGKKCKGIREGGVSENSSWYVFMQAKDGAFEAFPIAEWYNFKQIQRYKALSAEEAEKEFERRDKIMNYFSVMYQKKFRKDEEITDGDEEGSKKKSSSLDNQLLLSELDDWMSDSEGGGDDDEDEDKEESSQKKNKKKVQSKQRTQRGGKKNRSEGSGDDSCLEESDEYDDGAEHDYISSDSSDSEAEDDEVVRKELAGVEEDDGLKKLLNNEDFDEEEKEKEKKEEEEKKDTEEKEEKEKKKKKKKKSKKQDTKEDDSDGKSTDVSDEEGAGKKKKKDSKQSKKDAADKGDDNDGVKGLKRKLQNDSHDDDLSKRKRTDMNAAGPSSPVVIPGSDSGVTEEAVRRYLMRKPMTTTELLHKFKCKKTGLNSDQLVHAIAQILKRINLTKQTVKGKMYLSIKQTNT